MSPATPHPGPTPQASGALPDQLRGLAPMKATSGPVPVGDDWAFEVKWDGMRVLTAVDPAVPLEARSANGIDVTVRFPELSELAAAVGGRSAVLDGEVVVLDERGRSDFGALQGRMHVERPDRVARAAARLAVTYVVFDLLVLDGHRLLSVPYEDRRHLLLELVEAQPHVLAPAHQVGEGAALFEVARASGLEGIMAKRLTSTYEPGHRSAAWRKCKIRHRQEVVIGGWAAGEGSRANRLGSILVGVHDPDAPGRPLRYAGRVGTGLTDEMMAVLTTHLADLASPTSPFSPDPPRQDARAVTWVRPTLVAEVEFAEWTTDGRLRHPSFVGLRIDKAPVDVIREPPPS